MSKDEIYERAEIILMMEYPLLVRPLYAHLEDVGLDKRIEYWNVLSRNLSGHIDFPFGEDMSESGFDSILIECIYLEMRYQFMVPLLSNVRVIVEKREDWGFNDDEMNELICNEIELRTNEMIRKMGVVGQMFTMYVYYICYIAFN